MAPTDPKRTVSSCETDININHLLSEMLSLLARGAEVTMKFATLTILLLGSLSYAQPQFDSIVQVTSTSVEERSPAISPDGRYLAFLTNSKFGEPNQLGVLQLSNGRARSMSDSLNLQDGISWRDENTILAGDLNARGGRIIAIDLKTSSISVLYEDERQVAFVSEGVVPNTLLFSRLNEPSLGLPDEPNFAVWQLDLATGEATQLYDSPARDVQPMAMQNGKISFFSRVDTMGQSDEIYALDPQSREAERLLANVGDDFGPAPSPNGGWIAFANNAGAAPALYLLDLDSGNVYPVSAMEKRLSQPAWSPDGKYLYFVAREAGSPADIYRVSVSSSVSIRSNN